MISRSAGITHRSHRLRAGNAFRSHHFCHLPPPREMDSLLPKVSTLGSLPWPQSGAAVLIHGLEKRTDLMVESAAMEADRLSNIMRKSRPGLRDWWH